MTEIESFSIKPRISNTDLLNETFDIEQQQNKNNNNGNIVSNNKNNNMNDNNHRVSFMDYAKDNVVVIIAMCVIIVILICVIVYLFVGKKVVDTFSKTKQNTPQLPINHPQQNYQQNPSNYPPNYQQHPQHQQNYPSIQQPQPQFNPNFNKHFGNNPPNLPTVSLPPDTPAIPLPASQTVSLPTGGDNNSNKSKITNKKQREANMTSILNTLNDVNIDSENEVVDDNNDYDMDQHIIDINSLANVD